MVAKPASAAMGRPAGARRGMSLFMDEPSPLPGIPGSVPYLTLMRFKRVPLLAACFGAFVPSLVAAAIERKPSLTAR